MPSCQRLAAGCTVERPGQLAALPQAVPGPLALHGLLSCGVPSALSTPGELESPVVLLSTVPVTQCPRPTEEEHRAGADLACSPAAGAKPSVACRACERPGAAGTNATNLQLKQQRSVLPSSAQGSDTQAWPAPHSLLGLWGGPSFRFLI